MVLKFVIILKIIIEPKKFISALKNTEDIIQGFNAGGVDYITKPFYKEEVLVRIKNHIDLKLTKEKLKEKIKLLDKEIIKALNIHGKTLPKEIPEIDNISIAAYYQPAERLGGDFYDIIRKDNKLIVYLSDITGHGLEAAIMSSFIKNTINSYVAVSSIAKLTPTNIINFLAAQYYKEDYPEDYFICIYLVVLDLKTGEMLYSGMGFQDLPIICGQDFKKKNLISKGLPISKSVPFKYLDIKTKRIKLLPGELFVMNTDGITEQMVTGDYYLERFNKIVCQNSNSNLPVAVIIEKIKQDFYEFNECNNQGNDDITLVALKMKSDDLREYRFELASTREEISHLPDELTAILPDSVKGQLIAMGIQELAINAAEHGNKFIKNKKVVINIQITANYVFAIIEDEGEGFTEKQNYLLKLDCDQERGRGIAMTKECCDLLFYNKKGNIGYILNYLK
jgi:sigma-B regulation protein RsbU (phosphoserine phosphatase)